MGEQPPGEEIQCHDLLNSEFSPHVADYGRKDYGKMFAHAELPPKLE